MEARLTDLGELPMGARIWDVGAYEGRWAWDMFDRYPTAILHLFEPVPDYALRLLIEARIRDPQHESIAVTKAGLSDKTGTAEITIAGDRSSTYEMGYLGTGIAQIALVDVLEALGSQFVHVMKVNIEGEEYPVLERLIVSGKVSQIGTLLVQFHTFIPHFGERYLGIRRGLLKTHTPTWRDPFVWERWDLR